MTPRGLLLVLSTLAAAACAGAAWGQTTALEETRIYAGVGRIKWTLSPGLRTIFAVPHFTGGPRIKCADDKTECEIQVQARAIDKPLDERIAEFKEKLAPFLPDATDKSLRILYYGADKSVVYTTLEDSRQDQPFRFLTAGFAIKGPALIQFSVATNEAAASEEVLKITAAAKSLDALEVWALRLGDYKATCNERFSAYAKANDAAFASSKFAKVDLVKFVMGNDATLTEEAVRKQLANVREGFAQSFDAETPERRKTFCSKFPQWVKNAESSL